MNGGLCFVIVLLLLGIVLLATDAAFSRDSVASWRATSIQWHDAHEQLVWELAERDATIARLMNTIDELREELSEADESLPFNQLESLHRVE